MRYALVCALLVLCVTACGGTKTVTVTQTVTVSTTVRVTTQAGVPSTAVCSAGDLSGTFEVVSGSAGAGNISYVLRLENNGAGACSLSGLPDVQLVGRNGADLPTNVQPSGRSGPTVAHVVLQHGEDAVAEARFSPDVPGGNEPGDAPCEPKAVTLRVTSGGDTLETAVDPATPVCEHGTLSFDDFSAAP
jgi:Protein of unknown function (DUF4232)